VKPSLLLSSSFDSSDVPSIHLLLVQKGQTDRIQQRIFAERFKQAVDGAVCHHPGDHIIVPMCSDENNRDSMPKRFQLLLQLRATHSRHSDV